MQSILSVFALLLFDTTTGYLIPNPPGKYNVTVTTGALVDYMRDDPYAAIPRPRELMLSVFQPTMCTSTTPLLYMPSQTAEYQGPFLQQTFNISYDLSSIFLEARLPVCSVHPSNYPHPDDSRILLFSPGYAIPRFYYNALASAIASEGFMVITIDHPEDANIIEYPDGHTVYNNASIWDLPTKGEYVRAADASFIIDQLSNSTAMSKLLPQHGPRSFSTDRVAMLGHSLGGASAIIAASQDPRIRGAINWDGTIFGPLPTAGVSQPVLMISNAETIPPPDWQEAWPHLKGPKLWITIANSTHQSFSDIPTLLQAAGQNTAEFSSLLGTITPEKMVGILTAYTTAWMTGAIEGTEESPILQGKESVEYPEISIVMKGNF